MSTAPPGLPPAEGARPVLSDSAMVVLAALIWVGARTATPIPIGLGLGVTLLAVVVRRPKLLLLGGALFASTMGHRAVGGLQPAAPRPYRGTVTLLSDPVDRFGAASADARVGRRRLELQASGAGRSVLDPLLAGERVTVVGQIGPLPAGDGWLVPRHIVGVLAAQEVDPSGPGAAPWRAANVLRRTLVRGAGVMAPGPRSLFTGFVLGDDRDQPVTLTDDFRGSGLTHLLAVSGENVAFVLALVAPVLRRLRLGPRWFLTVGVIAFFCLLTRFEPSVLRAGVMAGLATTAFALGRPVAGVRILALAVGALVLIDPLLTRAVGFQLSVAASAGILVVSPRLRAMLPGPALFADPMAVTIGAQLAVAPLLVTTFGGVPVASLPANLLAAPAAGLVMTWGLGAGIPAGLLGPGAARVLHGPTALGIAWIAGVARVSSSLPLGQLDRRSVLVLGGLVALAIGAHRLGWAPMRRVALMAAVVVLMVPAWALRHPAPGASAVAGGELWRGGGATVLVVGAVTSPGTLLGDLRALGVRRIDLMVTTSGPKSAPVTVATVAHHWPPHRLWEGPGMSVPGAVRPGLGSQLHLGGITAAVTATTPKLLVQVTG